MTGGLLVPRPPRNPPSIAEQIALAADREGPEFDTAVLGLTLALFRTATAFERAHATELMPHGLNIGQLNILTVLDRAAEPLTMGALGQAVSVLPANLTGVVDGLVNRGYVERILNPSDRRSFLIRIGKGGRSFLRKFLPGHWARLQTLMSDLTPAQRRQLQSLLGKFLESIEENGKDTAADAQGVPVRRPARRGGAVPT
jgi:DNA-binding MarR family transcriptional regulator